MTKNKRFPGICQFAFAMIGLTLLAAAPLAAQADTVDYVQATQTTYVAPYHTYPHFTVPPENSIAAEYSILLSLYQSFYGSITAQCSYPLTIYPTPSVDGAVADVQYTSPCHGGNQIFATVVPGVPGHCPDGYSPDQPAPNTTTCSKPDPTTTDTGPSNNGSQNTGEPINAGTGDVTQTMTDYQGPGPFPLAFSRTYNSMNATGVSGRLGSNWNDNLESDRIYYQCGVSYTYYDQVDHEDRSQCDYWEAVLTRTDGSQLNFYLPYAAYNNFFQNVWSGLGGAASPALFFSTDITPSGQRIDASRGGSLQINQQGYTYQDGSGQVEQFDKTGRLLSVTAPGGFTHNYQYDSSGRIASVSDGFGHSLTFTYDVSSRLQTVTNPAGGVYTYSYDSSGNLIEVQYPDQTNVKYQYDDSTFPHALTGMVDEDGNTLVTWQYDAEGRGIASSFAAGAFATSIAYLSGGGAEISETIGGKRDLTFQKILGVTRMTSASVPCAYCKDKRQAISYDDYGSPSRSVDFDGNVTTYVHDSAGRELSRTEAYGTQDARTITTSWNTTFNEPTLITEPGRTTAYTYDGVGNMLTKTVTDTATNVARTTTYTYNAQGLLATLTDPMNHVTSYSYDSQGDVSTITNALNQVTQFTQYDANGLPLTIIDPNGVITTLTYDARQRPTSRTVAGAETQFAYDPAGNLMQVTLPTGTSLKYRYDVAHRLTGITDSAGNSITYTLDTLGNRIKQQAYDPSGTLKKTLQRTYNSLNQLLTTVGGVNQTTTYADDAMGNTTSVQDPMAHVTSQSFDALNRLVTVVDPENGNTTYNYDSLNRVQDLTDPRGLDTHYTYDAFGDVLTQQSPDTGTTSYTYDLDGNRLTKTDAKGVTASYSYDALNRLTGITYPDTAENITYAYDQGTDGIGRLAGMMDQSGSTSYQYDAHGNVIQKTTVVDGHSFTVAYQYDTEDNLTGMTYPDGMQVNYGRDAAERISGVTATVGGTGQSVASGITYEPFGPITGFTYGNGLTETRSYDQDYRLTGVTVPSIASWNYTDNADNDITAIADGVTSGNSQSLGYDSLDRLTSAQGAYGTLGYSYDLDGNRTQETSNGSATALTYDTSSNRLLTVGTQSDQYDANGNIIADGLHTYAYNDANRLSGYDSQSGVYLYNGLGQRVRKPSPVIPGDANGDGVINQLDLLALHAALKGQIPITPGMDCNQDGVVDMKDNSCIAQKIGSSKNQGKGNGSTPFPAVTTTGTSQYRYFVYDEAGHLIGEYDTNGNVVQEHIWLNDRPIAIENAGSLDYVTTDQLNTPRVITDSSGAVVWSWTSDPFGANAPTGSLVYNLRFAGQYFDQETSHHYNVNRDYDVGTGRYIESDQIGLGGGINTYTYVKDNPISRIDPYGLYSCTYDIISHTLICIPDNPDDPGFSSNNYVSGNNGGGLGCQNDPACVNVNGHGPLPEGDYSVGPRTTPSGGRRVLTPLFPMLPSRDDGVPFETHGCTNPATCSTGCIAATANATRDEFNNDMDMESHNTITVVSGTPGQNTSDLGP